MPKSYEEKRVKFLNRAEQKEFIKYNSSIFFNKFRNTPILVSNLAPPITAIFSLSFIWKILFKFSKSAMIYYHLFNSKWLPHITYIQFKITITTSIPHIQFKWSPSLIFNSKWPPLVSSLISLLFHKTIQTY